MSNKRVLAALGLCLCTINCAAQNPDIDLLKELNLHRDRALDSFFKIVTDYAAPLTYCIPFFLLFYAMIKGYKALRSKSVFVIESTMLALAVSQALKYIVNRPRPFVTYPFLEKMTTGGSPSFPSGHTTDAFTLAASLSFVFPKWYVIVPSFAWACAVGYSRMDLGVHYPSDVGGAVIIGILCPAVLFLLKRRAEQRRIKAQGNRNIPPIGGK